MSRLRLLVGAATDAGRVRSVNEDKALVSEELVAVADGMGGHVGGEVAARTAIDALRSSFARNRGARGLLSAVEQANRAVYDQSLLDRSLRGMGTTLTAAAVVHERAGDKVVLVNVGDSRAYLLDHSGLVRLTEDHSLVEEMVRRGELTPAEAAVHPHRHIVTRVLGIDETIEVDAWELEPERGARLLLCSDGLTNELDDNELESVLAERRSAPETARELVARALSHGGSDNITVVVVDFDRDGQGAPRQEPVVLGEQPTGRDNGTGAAGDAPAAAPTGRGNGAADPATVAVTRVPAATDGEAGRDTPARAGAAGGEDRAGATGRTTPATSAVAAVATPGQAGTAGSAIGNGSSGGRDTGAGHGAPATAAVQAVRPARPRTAPAATRVVAQPAVRVRHERIMTFRVAFFVLLLVGVLGGSAVFVRWFIKASYYVGVVDGRVAILEGRPGGLLWFKPTLVERTGLSVSSVFAPNRAYLEAGMEEPTLAAARQVVLQLSNSSTFLSTPSGNSGQADGIPPGSTLVPISSPTPTVATLPPVVATTSPTLAPGQLSKDIAGAVSGLVGGHAKGTAAAGRTKGAG